MPSASNGSRESEVSEFALFGPDQEVQVIADPFPHFVIDGALCRERFDKLCHRLPSDDWLAGPQYKGPNRYHRRSAAELLGPECPHLSDAWKRFIDFHISATFFDLCRATFESHLTQANDVVRNMTGRHLNEIRPAMRYKNGCESAPALMECQISHVTPADKPASPLGPHVDRELTLWAGLYYLQGCGNDEGGNLVFYRWRDPDRREYWRDQMIPPSLVEPVKTIEAKPNRLVMFLHGPDAVHGVTARRPGNGPRQSVNLVCEFPFKVWSIEPWRKNLDQFPGLND